ncbi:MAG: HAMP domain-containing histidine kinase [Deferribacterales bacterium]
MELDNDLDKLKIGKFFYNRRSLMPYNYYAENILNYITININEDPKLYIDKLIKNSVKLFDISSYRYGLNVLGENLYIIDLTDYTSDINLFIDLLALQHEIKNPLTVIDGVSQILTSKSNEQFVLTSAEIIRKESGRIKEIIESFSIIYKELTFNVILIREFLEELILSIKAVFPDIEFFVEVDPEIKYVKCDREFLFRAFFNILKNSCEAKNDTKIKISVSFDTALKIRDKVNNKTIKMVKFDITDSAGGIPENDISKVFNPFYSTKSKGAGLGLFIAKNIIEKHNGRVFFNSTFGIGTTFHILLPLD